ncbi:MAG: 3-isopropylmalate dehydratase small subunit [Candidatus Omnitrophica bacterium]|nr:3-isopropylmalate dehydratase small subunit [Candidatus Omnitrophota bacterium]
MTHAAHRLLKIQDNVNTDYIISGRYKFQIRDPKELAKHVFEDIETNFYKKIKKGDFLVSGENFGCGSSREQAPQALKAMGFRAVVAKSFARIFYRNALNLGLYLLECNTNYIDDGNEIELDLDANILKNKSKGLNIAFKPVPPLAKKILAEGGMIEYFKKYGKLEVNE